MEMQRNEEVLKDFLWDSQRIVDHAEAARQLAKQHHRNHEIESKRNLTETNYKISEKIEQLHDARRKLLEASVNVEETLAKLDTAKKNSDAFFQQCQHHNAVMNSLIGIRERNNLLKPSSDPIRREINDIVGVINNAEKTYHKHSFDCRLAISALLANKQEIELDLSSKRSAQIVDEDQLVKTKFSPYVTFKPTPSRLPDGAHNDVQWVRNLNDLLNDTYSKIANALNLIKSIESFVENQRLDNSAKFDTLSRLLRQVYDRLNAALYNYDGQLQKVNNELQKNEKDIVDLGVALENHADNVKLVETRLENRHFVRPLVAERTVDVADHALKLERQKLAENGRLLEDQLKALKEARKLLVASQNQIKNEIDNTKRLIDTERVCFNDLEAAKDRYVNESWRKVYNSSSTTRNVNYEETNLPLID